MRILMKSAVMALALAGTTLVTAGAANADRYDGRDRSGSVISIGLGNVAFGYRDGYWDGGHRWAHCNSTNFHHCLDAVGATESWRKSKGHT